MRHNSLRILRVRYVLCDGEKSNSHLNLLNRVGFPDPLGASQARLSRYLVATFCRADPKRFRFLWVKSGLLQCIQVILFDKITQAIKSTLSRSTFIQIKSIY